MASPRPPGGEEGIPPGTVRGEQGERDDGEDEVVDEDGFEPAAQGAAVGVQDGRGGVEGGDGGRCRLDGDEDDAQGKAERIGDEDGDGDGVGGRG